MIIYYDKCKSSSSSTSDVQYVLKLLEAFQSTTGIGFPLYNGIVGDPPMPTATQLGAAIGYLFGVHNIPTFLTPYIDTNWGSPSDGYMLLVDQTTLLYEATYYTKPVANFNISLRAEIRAIFEALKPDLDNTTLFNDVEDIVNMEYAIVRTLLASDADKRLYARQFNIISSREANDQYTFLDWPTLLKHIGHFGNPDVQKMMNDSSFKFVLNEPALLLKLNNALGTGALKARTILNYLNLRLAYNYQSFLGQVGFN